MPELKPGWRRVKFGQLAECINDRVDDPSKAGVDRYVGLDHLDPENLKIRRWGTPDEVESTKLRFRPGDIIFGKRRAYQRKLAVADFEGICSAHAMVLRAKPAVVLPEFLPFFMQSNTFMERAVEISVGSLSPTINWKTLAAEEFVLPPLEEQLRLVILLGAASRNLDNNRTLLHCAQMALRAALYNQLPPENSPYDRVPLELIVARFIDYRGRTPEKTQSGVPLVTAKNVRDGFLDFSNPEFIDTTGYDAWMTRGIPNEGDVLFTTEAPLGLIARAPAGRFALAQRIICLQPIQELASGYLFWAMRSFGVQREIRKRSTGTTVAGIKQSVLRYIAVPLPSRDKQSAIVDALDTLSHACDSAERRLGASETLYSSLRERALMGIR